MSGYTPTEEDIKIAKRTIKKLYKNNVWDNDWLCEKYPDRFEGFYEVWELGDDRFDEALENEIQHDEDPRWIIRQKILPKSET